MSAMTGPTPSTAAHHRERLTFSTEWIDPTVVRITVAGEMDACNAAQLRDYVFARTTNCRTLVLDLHGVEFFSTAGLSMLHAINNRCDRTTVRWTLHCSPSVSRVLDICAPDGILATR